MIDQATLSAFADELEKIASKELPDLESLKKFLKPGDILYTKPKTFSSIPYHLFWEVLSKVQGSPYTHVGIYVGDGHVVDAGLWKKGDSSRASAKVHKVPLETYAKRYNFKVLRVDAPKDKRDEAVAYAKEQVGKDFNLSGMLRLILPFQSEADRKREREDAASSLFCSELVANAYNDVGIAKRKQLKYVMPGDIFRSPKTKTVAEY